jgi:N-acetylneuraminate synthase
MYKVASFEIIDIPLIEKIARTGKPMIISTGMATEEEITEAVNAAINAGNTQISLLRTNSAYPAPVDEMDLRAIPYMAEKWGVPVGLSDHTLDHTSAIVATALGARIFEKHLTLRRSDGGPDAAFSLEPEEFADYVAKINDAFSSLGTARLGPSPRERDSLRFRPSIRAIKDISQGEMFTSENTATVRPAGGMHPRHLPAVIGRSANSDFRVGDAILEEFLGD